MMSPAASDEGRHEPPLSEALPEPLVRDDVPRLLDPFGFAANSGLEWAGPLATELSLEVRGHRKAGGHVYYHVGGSLARRGEWHAPFYTWAVARRLGHLREGLHDPVKQALGPDYREHFADAHFAHKVHVKGTTGRLDAWCKRLAAGVTSRAMPPVIAALALHMLLPPGVGAEEVGRARAAAAAAGETGAAAGRAVPRAAPGAAEADVDLTEASNPFTTDVLSERGSCSGASSPVRRRAPAGGGGAESPVAPPSGASARTGDGTEYTDSFEPYDGSETSASGGEEETRSGGPRGGAGLAPAPKGALFRAAGAGPQAAEETDDI